MFVLLLAFACTLLGFVPLVQVREGAGIVPSCIHAHWPLHMQAQVNVEAVRLCTCSCC
jgi:hypothetical protein